MYPGQLNKKNTPIPQYFVECKKSEINKLREVLKKLPQERNDDKKREVLKKVIAYMTLGVDVSKLFPDIIMISSTNDIIQKKMIYLYLNNYAETYSELSLLTINTLQKDSKDEDPRIRGLALRSFCNLRINNIFEYIEGPLFNGLNDKNLYVRRIAIISCVKLIKMNPKLSIKNDVVKILKNMLLDNDPQCIINAVYSLNEILIDEGGLKVNKKIIFNMLNRISVFNEWGKCVVLNIVNTYVPTDEDEMYDIMNILENHIRDFSATVFLSCLKCFLNLSMNDIDLQIQVFERMKDPLLTLISTSPCEIAYVVLIHTHLLLHEANKINYRIFDYDYKHFFFRFNDLTYIKDIKLDILVSVASKNNALLIISELSEYISDSNLEIAKKSIYSIGCIALKIPSVISKTVELALSWFLPINDSCITSATLSILVNILRKYEEYTKVIIEQVMKYDAKAIDNDGIISYIWIVGEYCDYIENTPYILEEYVNLTDCSYSFMFELLTACVKVLFKRPSEMKYIFVSLFDNILKNYKYPELTDKLYFYYKLINYDYEQAHSVIACKKKLVSNFCESNENLLLDKLYNEFNTLSVLHKQPINKFIKYSKICFGGVYDPEESSDTDSLKKDSDKLHVSYDSIDRKHVHYSNINGKDTNKSYISDSNYTNNDNIDSDYDQKENNNLLNISEDILQIYDKNGYQTNNENANNETSAVHKNFHIDPNNNNDYITLDGTALSSNNTLQNGNYNKTNMYECEVSNVYNFKKLKEILIEPNDINPEIYQEQWSTLLEKNNEKIYLRKNYHNLKLKAIDELISKYNVITLASGEIDQCLKFYMYSQFYTLHYIFIELIFNKKEKYINWILKSQCEDPDLIEKFTDCFRDIFIDYM